MALGNLKTSHNFTGETGYIIAVWRKASNPLTIVGQVVYPAPHTQRSLLITDLEFGFYTIKFYRSVDGVTLGAEVLTLAGNSADGVLYSQVTYEYVVDREHDNTTPVSTGTEVWADPVTDDIGIRDERLKDKNYNVEIRGMGTVATDELDIRNDEGGGFDINTGFKFESDQKIFVHVQVKQDAISSSSSGSGEVSDIITISDNTDFNVNTHAGKLIIVNFAAGIRNLSFANLSTIPDCFFKIQSHGSNYFCGIKLDAGDTVKVCGEDLNTVWLGLGEEATVIIRNNAMYFVKAPKGYKEVGQRVWVEIAEQNILFRDGTQYNQADVPRLTQYVNKLPPSMICEEGAGVGQWNYAATINGETVYPNKGKYAISNTGTPTIRVPDDRDRHMRALKSNVLDNVDPENVSANAGGYIHDMLRSHTHTTSSGWYWYGVNGRGNLSSNNDAVRNDSANRSNNALQSTGGNETRVKATRMIAAVRI